MDEPITSDMMAEAEDTAAREIREKKIAAIRAKEEAAKQASDEEGKSGGASTGMRKGTDSLLRLAWTSLVPSFGLSIIWIDVHWILRQVFGEKRFSKYGDEWRVVKMPMEGYGVFILNLVALMAGISIVAVLVIVIKIVTAPISTAVEYIFGR